MKYISAIAFLFFLNSSASAQIIDLTKPMKCSEVETVMLYFLQNHKESPVWVGKTVQNTHITLLMNKETRSWTMVEYDSRYGCVLGAGDDKSGSDPAFGVKYSVQR